MSELKNLELPFPMSEYERRMNKVRDGMEKKSLNVLVESDPRNIYYLTGNRIDLNPQYLIVWDGEPVTVVRYLEAWTAKASSWVKNWVTYRDEGPVLPYDPIGALADALKGQRLDRKKIGLNLDSLSISAFNRLQKLLPDTEFLDGSGIVDNVKLFKSRLEQDYMRKATKINQEALLKTINDLEIGKTETDIMIEAVKNHAEAGNEFGVHIKPWIQVGIHAEYCHTVFYGPDALEVQKGDVVFMEMGAYVKRYAGTMCRCASIGEPREVVKRAADASIEGLNRGIEAVKPGVTSEEVDTACRSHIAKAGFGDYFRHRTGYSIGIDWSEGHIFSIEPKNKSVLKPGMTFHFIPALYIPGLGCLGASENILVTEDGHEVYGTLERILFIR